MFAPQIFVTQSYFGPKFFNLNFLDHNFLGPIFFLTQKFLGPNFFLPKIVLDQTLLDLKVFGHWLFLDQNFFVPDFFLTKTTTIITTTTRTLMGFDTIEINLVVSINIFDRMKFWVWSKKWTYECVDKKNGKQILIKNKLAQNTFLVTIE